MSIVYLSGPPTRLLNIYFCVIKWVSTRLINIYIYVWCIKVGLNPTYKYIYFIYINFVRQHQPKPLTQLLLIYIRCGSSFLNNYKTATYKPF